jgi:DNA replication protein DnaC
MSPDCERCGKPIDLEPVLFEGRTVYQPRLCAACQASREAELAERLAVQRIESSKRKRAAEWEALCPPLYRDTDLAQLPADAKPSIRRVLAWQYGPRGLLLHGPTGRGKTRSVYVLLRRLHFDEGRRIATFDAVSFSHQCSQKFFDGRGEGWINGLARRDVVFFDDLGKARVTDRVEAELFGLIEGRMARQVPTIITTNFVASLLAEKLTQDRADALIRRLVESAECIPF